MAIPVSDQHLLQGALSLYSKLDDSPVEEATKLWSAGAFARLEATTRRVLPPEDAQGALSALTEAARDLRALVGQLNFSTPLAEIEQAELVRLCGTIDETRLSFRGHVSMQEGADAELHTLMSVLREKVCSDMLAKIEMQSHGAEASLAAQNSQKWEGAKSDFTFLEVVDSLIKDWEPVQFGDFDGDDAAYLLGRLAEKHLVGHMN